MRTIRIEYKQKITFSKYVEVDDDEAEQLLELDGADVYMGVSAGDFELITEYINPHTDVLDADSELEQVSITEITE